MKPGLATEEMQDCPTCGTPTFEVGPCFACTAKAGDAKEPWSKIEISVMTAFARGFVTGWLDRPGDEPLTDQWVTYDDDISIRFYVPEFQDAGIEVLAYRKVSVTRDGQQGYDFEDEVRLI